MHILFAAEYVIFILSLFKLSLVFIYMINFCLTNVKICIPKVMWTLIQPDFKNVFQTFSIKSHALGALALALPGLSVLWGLV